MVGHEGNVLLNEAAVYPAHALRIVYTEVIVCNAESSVGVVVPGQIVPVPLSVVHPHEIPRVRLSGIPGNVDIFHTAIVEHQLKRLGVRLAHAPALGENADNVMGKRRILGSDSVGLVGVVRAVNNGVVYRKSHSVGAVGHNASDCALCRRVYLRVVTATNRRGGVFLVYKQVQGHLAVLYLRGEPIIKRMIRFISAPNADRLLGG